ncbi:putative MFS family arabinose efflux permease [Rathayibacter sp. PhB152]|uniref:MFS transporter n=1 Tax=Rathayibacter sp. PhB152 TaxID=2485190 RepID=UPI000F4BA5FB|nr:MFS transporter [Rathayibacter sp. PhB152]ROQ64753.1 putative MFS family arabinose efflux permease [Rathayibacter sp. PhB152]
MVLDTPRSAPRDTAPRRLRDAWIALAGLSAVFLFEMLDNSVLNIALPTLGRELHASTAGLQWVTGAYSVAFGGLMLLFGAVADRFGRRRVMLAGLVLLAAASLATAAVTTTEQLIAVRAVMGIAAAMTTPGSMALAFRLFGTDDLRVRALTVVSTAGLVGLAVGPTAGGLVLAVAPWQVLLLANVPIAVLALIGIRLGVPADAPGDLHRDPIDVVGALLGTVTIAAALVAPTLFVGTGSTGTDADGTGTGIGPWAPWATVVTAALAGAGFVLRQRTARHPLLDLRLVALPLVSSGLAFKAATGLSVGGLSYLVTLQLQLAWGWSPAAAALGLLPQVVVLLAGGRFVGPFVTRVGLERAAALSAGAVVAGLAVFGLLGRLGYGWVLVALVLVAAGMRVVGVVAGTNVLRGLPAERTSVGAALVDTASELATAVGIAAGGTILSALVAGSITSARATAAGAEQLSGAVGVAGLVLAGLAAALVALGVLRARTSPSER